MSGGRASEGPLLTAEERAMLGGEAGPAARRALEIVVTLGRIYGAERLAPVSSVQVAGVSYRNLGEAGLQFLEDWAAEGARVRVPTTLNPAGMDLVAWRAMGITEEFAREQQRVVGAYTRMGILPTCTCTPYLVRNVPAPGEHVAWSESSAVCYANACLGARTNCEGGPSALAAAICGRTAAYGYHLDAGRRATHLVRVHPSATVREDWQFAALGYLVGQQVGDGVPYFQGLDLPPAPQADALSRDALKLLGAALASSGAVALFHVEGSTPEALARGRSDLLPAGVPTIDVDAEALAGAVNALNADVTDIDLVVIGCPHASLEELRRVAEALRGQRLAAALWVTTSRAVRDEAEALGLAEDIERAGGRVVADGCVIVAPMADLAYRSLATNSAKMAHYALPHAGLRARLGSLDHCLQAAIRGQWRTLVH